MSILGGDGMTSEGLYTLQLSQLATDGDVVEDADRPVFNIRQHVFRICTKLSYQSKKDYEKLTSRHSMSPEELDTVRLRAADEHARNEDALHATHSEGQTVMYGQVVQLQHEMSGKFVTLNRRSAADHEKDSLKVALDPTGDEGSWFQLMPRFTQSGREGAPVFATHEVSFHSVKLGEEYSLHEHAAPLEGTAGAALDARLDAQATLREVNVATAVTGWSLLPFSSEDPADVTTPVKDDNSKPLEVGSAVRLYHSESGFLTASTKHFKRHVYLRQRQENSGNAVEQSSKSIFIVEHVNSLSGGAVKWKHAYRLRHLLTGRYLTTSFSREGAHPERRGGCRGWG